MKEGCKDKELSEAFNNKDVPDKKFEKMLVKSKEDYSVFSVFSKKVRRIGEAEEKIDVRKKIELSFGEQPELWRKKIAWGGSIFADEIKSKGKPELNCI